MTIYPTTTYEQFLDTVTAVLNRRRKPKKKLIGILVGALLGVATGLLFGYPQTRISACIIFVFFLGWIIYCKRAVAKQSDSNMRRLYEDQHFILNNQVMQIDASGISGSWSDGRATYNYVWSCFAEYLERPGSLLFLYAPCCYIRVPKQNLSATELSEIIRWYQAAKGSQS